MKSRSHADRHTAASPLRIVSAAVLGMAVLLSGGVRTATAALSPESTEMPGATISDPEVTAEQASFTPVADSFVESTKPTRNHGTKTLLRVDGSPPVNSYLRFDVQGATDFSSATLRLFILSNTNTGVAVHPVADNTWAETTITYENAPAFGGVAGTSGPAVSETWVEIDVTALVIQNGQRSFALTGPGTTAVSVGSRESANSPQLIIGPAAPPPPPPPPPGDAFTVSRIGTTSTYEAVSSTHTFTGALKSVVESAVNVVNGAGGGSITFTAGDFDLGAEWFELDAISNITFSGAGMSATTLRNFASAATDTEPFDVVVATNVTIRDLTVRAGGPLRTTSDGIDFDAGNGILIERVQVSESRGKGIVFDGKGAGWSANGNTVRDCVIAGVPGDGIELLASSNNVIEGCTITGVGGHGIQATKSSTSAEQPNKKSSNNIIRNNTIDQAGQDGINVNSSDANQITGNTITNSADDTSGRDGIRIQAADSVTCNDNAVNGNWATDNQATKTQSYGLHISSSLCNRTVVGVAAPNDFAGNRIGPIRDVGTGTIYPAPVADTQPPTQPSGLSATAVSGCRVDLSWSASTDNVGVTQYRIFRDGSPLQSVGGATLSFQDTTVSPGTGYSYTVDAVDAAGNDSTDAGPAPVTTPVTACTSSLTAIADSWVDSSQPTRNFGTSTQLRCDGSPVLVAYLKFNVEAPSPPGSVKLRIFANSSHSTGFSVHPVTDTTWGETTINWDNAPSRGAPVASSGPLTAGTWVEVDVSSLVTANGVISLALTTSSGTAMSLASRESGANAPVLVLATE